MNSNGKLVEKIGLGLTGDNALNHYLKKGSMLGKKENLQLKEGDLVLWLCRDLNLLPTPIGEILNKCKLEFDTEHNDLVWWEA